MGLKKMRKVGVLTKNYFDSFFYKREELIFIAMAIGTKNWGDALNLPLVQRISGKKAVVAYDPLRKLLRLSADNYPVYSVIGSVLEIQSHYHKLSIWGSGFISYQGKFHQDPQDIFAVRGPLTRDLIIENGYDCPKIYGDPALLYPLYYRPKVEKKYKLGVIPHFMDKNSPWLRKIGSDPSILIINIFDDINKVIDNICSCEYIASSSLHGIIASDSYCIPSVWIELSDQVPGDGFKFVDYFESVGRKDGEPIVIKGNENLNDVIGGIKSNRLNINLNKLIEACPFKRYDINYSQLINKHPLNVK